MRREPQPQFNSNPHNMSFCLYISIYRHSVTHVGRRHQCTFVNMSWGKRYLNSTSVVSCVMSLCMWYRLWWILRCRYGKWFHFLAGKHLHEQHSRAYLDSKDALYESSLVPRLSWNANIYRAESLVSFVRKHDVIKIGQKQKGNIYALFNQLCFNTRCVCYSMPNS